VVRAVRALRHLPGLTAARIGAVLFAGMVVGRAPPLQANRPSRRNEKHLTPRLIAQRIMYCDDGSRADVDFIDDGLKMAVTWLPKGRTEILHAQRTGRRISRQTSPHGRVVGGAGRRLHAAREDPRLSSNTGGIIGYAGIALHACACVGGRARRDHREPHQVKCLASLAGLQHLAAGVVFAAAATEILPQVKHEASPSARLIGRGGGRR